MAEQTGVTLRQIVHGYEVCDSEGRVLGQVRRYWAPSAIRRGRWQASPVWRVYRQTNDYLGPVGSPSPRTGKTIYEHPTRREAVDALINGLVLPGTQKDALR